MADVTGLYRRFGVRLPGLGDGWASTRCFVGAHRDRHPSARVHLQSGGFRCFACGAKGGVLDALQLLGVPDRGEARRLAVEYGIIEPTRKRARQHHRVALAIPPVAAASPPLSVDAAEGDRVDYDNLRSGSAEVTLERSWVYIDAAGVPVGRVRRLDLADGTKRIWQERPNGDGWTPGLAGAHLPLYRLPEVLDHARQGQQILIVEGEKTVDALERLGIFATTNAGGSGKWRAEHTAALQGATVLAVCDCDLPGRQHAILLSTELLNAGVRVLGPLDPEPHRNDGFDIVDHLAGVAATVRAVTPDINDAQVRDRLRSHLQRLLPKALVDAAELQRRLEHATYTADPAGYAYIHCSRCGDRRVHRLTHGLAYCPCGSHQAAPS